MAEDPVKSIGPLELTAPLSITHLEHVHIILRVHHCILLIYDKKTKGNVLKNSLELRYQNVSAMALNSQLLIYLDEEPMWIPLGEPKIPTFQKKGWQNLNFRGDAKGIHKLAQIFYSECPRLLARVLCVNSASLVSHIVFTAPPTLERDVELLIGNVINSVHQENNFYDNFGFHFSMDREKIATAVLNSAVVPKLLNELQFSGMCAVFDSPAGQLYGKVEWATLAGEAAQRFDRSPHAVTAIRATAAIEFPSLTVAADRLREFLTRVLWQTAKAVGSEGPVTYWMLRIHNRDFWTTPGVSVELVTNQYVQISFSALPCESFVNHVHSTHTGRFRQGKSDTWLPRVYNSVFLLNKEGTKLIVEYAEVLGWVFDPELQQATINDLVLSMSKALAQMVSFMVLYDSKTSN